MNIKTVHRTGSKQTIFLIEDIHQNLEAQKHISAAIKTFGNKPGESPVLVGLEGADGKFIFDVYIGALYTETRVTSRDAVQALRGPKRLLMHFVYSEVAKEKIVSGWNDGFENNNSSERLKTLSQKIEQFNAMFPTMVEGDVVLLDYIPGRGTRVTIKGEVKGVVEGEDFNTALLDIWLGNEPADDDLKEALLGL